MSRVEDAFAAAYLIEQSGREGVVVEPGDLKNPNVLAASDILQGVISASVPMSDHESFGVEFVTGETVADFPLFDVPFNRLVWEGRLTDIVDRLAHAPDFALGRKLRPVLARAFTTGYLIERLPVHPDDLSNKGLLRAGTIAAKVIENELAPLYELFDLEAIGFAFRTGTATDGFDIMGGNFARKPLHLAVLNTCYKMIVDAGYGESDDEW